MKKITLILISLFNLQTQCWSQDNLWNNRENIIFQYESYTDTIYQYIILDNTNNISVGIYGSDTLEINHFIRPYTNREIDNESICDSLIIKLICQDCVDFHISKAINSKERNWIKLTDSLFISPKWVSKFIPNDKTTNIYTLPVMIITKVDSLTQIILYTEKVTKKKWKELKKGTYNHIK
ncbi:MAG: hypothetical protein V4622_10265 [Bacteroidota bacterium]